MRAAALSLAAALLTSCTTVQARSDSVQVDMQNVDLHMTDDIILHVRQLTGRFVALDRPAPYLDDKRSYVVAVDSGVIAIDLASLNTLMVRSTSGPRSNIRNLQVSINEDGTLTQKGSIDSGINVPFKTKATLSATPDGRIRVSTASVRSLGVPMNGLMKLLHFHMDNLVHVAPGTGVVADGNDLLLDPAQLLPAPSVRGRITAVRIEGNQVIETFGSGGRRDISGRQLAPNHIYWRGSQLSFGKLTMTDTDLELVDLDPRDPFDFSIDHWNAQLVAGYSKTQADRGLRAFMPDYNDLGSPHRTAAAR